MINNISDISKLVEIGTSKYQDHYNVIYAMHMLDP